MQNYVQTNCCSVLLLPFQGLGSVKIVCTNLFLWTSDMHFFSWGLFVDSFFCLFLSSFRECKFRSSQRRCSIGKGAFRNFVKLIEKHLYQTLFFPGACIFIKKRLWHWCFPVNFKKLLRRPFLRNTPGRLLLYVFSHHFRDLEFPS